MDWHKLEVLGVVPRFEDRLCAGPLVLDGAVGTELERRGIPCELPLWSAHALRTAPAVVAAIHTDYARAGAELLVANTFRTNPRTLRAAGSAAEGPELCRRAVALARAGAAAADRPCWVAASVGPVEDCYHPERTPGAEALAAEHGEWADWLAFAQPDLVWIETIGTVREAVAAAAAARERGLAYGLSLMLRADGALLGGETLAEAVRAVEPLGPVALGLNCIPPAGVSELLPHLRALTGVPLAAYAHIGNRVPLRGWSIAERPTPEAYAACVAEWIEAGATVVGGCCGTTPAHIAAVAAVVRRRE